MTGNRNKSTKGSRWKMLPLGALGAAALWACGREAGPEEPHAWETAKEYLQQEQEISGEAWEPAVLMEADFLLYNVDCGTQTPGSFPEGEHSGLYQSVSDRQYGADAQTGKKWGYLPDDAVLAETDSTGEGITAAKWVIDRETQIPAEETQIAYDFEVLPGDYQVTAGFYNPFSTRTVDVDCEGERMATEQKLLRYQLAEVQFETTVEDGILNLRMYNNNGRNFMDTPILSYIRVAVVPEYDRELLLTAMDRYAVQEETDYTAVSYREYCTAMEEAQALALQETGAYNAAPETAYKEKFVNLKRSFEMLEKKYRYDAFHPGEQWKDTESSLIQAHGGQIQRLTIEDDAGVLTEKWVWVGEDKSRETYGSICAYSSDDLYNWQFEGIIMRNVPSREALDTDSYFKRVYAGYTAEELDNVFRSLDAASAIIERPKLIYNEKTKQYVLWFHADGPTKESNSSYAAACAGVAVSDTPFGPYRFIDRYRLNTCPEGQEDMHPQSRGMARDMNLFVDTDKTAYIIYSSEENLTLYISKLNDSYTYLATEPENAVYGEDFIRLFPGAQREAPAMFRRNGIYYLMTSGCTGRAPNQARCYTADRILGEWTDRGDPCVDDIRHTTFESQSTCIFREPESDTWIYMGDRWNADNLEDSRYVWLPIMFDMQGDMHISFAEEWRLDTD